MSNWLRIAVRALLEVLLPVRCLRCGREVHVTDDETGTDGLRWCDDPQLCGDCRDTLLSPQPLVGSFGVGAAALTAAAGRPTDAGLVGIVSLWKYRGYRGLARPLAALAETAWDRAILAGGPVDRLVPIPLHPGRRRERGFDQARLLAELIGRRRHVPVAAGMLVRRRDTGQQAKLPSRADARALNVAGAFARGPDGGGPGLRVGLVDDLVTSGATTLAAAARLREDGAQVPWVIAAGLARRA